MSGETNHEAEHKELVQKALHMSVFLPQLRQMLLLHAGVSSLVDIDGMRCDC